jgi:GNAT superfamily N-acetyltransferase
MLLMDVGRASVADIPAIEALLQAAALPLDGAADAFSTGVVARDDARVVAAAALEPYGAAALLRSVVVAEDQRGTGVGRRIVEAAEASTGSRGWATGRSSGRPCPRRSAGPSSSRPCAGTRASPCIGRWVPPDAARAGRGPRNEETGAAEATPVDLV